MLPAGPYNSKDEEKKILDWWLESKFYKPEFNPKSNSLMSFEEMKSDSRQPWSLICPPPNAYARPHIGNISGYAYQDAMARYQRMKGKKVLMIPGKDHAGLEGEGVFIRDVLEKQGRKKWEMTREQFYSEMWEFFQNNMEIARKDEKEIGLSADYDRDIFTLDPKIVDTVLGTFVEMHKKDLIYKGVRIINWDTKAQSTLADNQVEREEREGKLYTIKYKIKDSDEFITVATTRPETMFGDTAIAVNPKDTTHADLVGKTALIPITEKEIPIITDFNVEMDFGTGALKITPAHAIDDYKIMQNWNELNPDKAISYVNVIDKFSRLIGPVPEEYKNRKYKEVLPELIAKLEELGQLEKTETIKQNVLISERTRAIVEPMISSQWFVRVDPFIDPVLKMIEDGKVKLHPKNMEKKFNFWMENLRDWAISRSLWWGYRLPVWYAGKVEERVDENGKVAEYIEINGEWVELKSDNPEHLKVQLEKPGENWVQDENVLDTWFSSGQWPYATLEAFDLMEEFYPTNVMETAADILENWVSRMMMFSWFKLDKEPFSDVHLHGLVLGADGQKMSKSRGNVLSVDELRETYGTDALRLCYFYQNSAGSSYAITHDKMKNFKNFCNKIWNAAKFVITNLESDQNFKVDKEFKELKYVSNQKIIMHINDLKEKITGNIEKFQFGAATENLYAEFWHTYCDIFLEESKPHLYTIKDKESGNVISEPNDEEKLETQKVLLYSLKQYLKMMHPFIPFITERIWKEVPKGENEHETLMYTKW